MIATVLAAAFAINNVSIEPLVLEKHVKYFASEGLEGRMTLRPGMDLTADYIAKEFKRYGLEGREANGGYIHEYDLSAGYRATKNNMLVFNLPGKELSLVQGRDFVPVVGSAMKLTRGNVVWVGYGNEDDYTDLDVNGKIVLMFRGGQDGRGRTNAMKARTAKEKGAIGVLFIGSLGKDRGEFPALTRVQGIADSLEMPCAAIHGRYFKEITGLDVEVAMANKERQSKPLNLLARMVSETEANTGKAKNVIGYLPGSDPTLRNEYIVIGGHFDHLGYGEIGSRTGSDAIHFGADDNGSGTAGVLAAAEWFAKNRGNRRTIIFQCYSGEELGLRGSRAWCDSNGNLLPSISAMLNMDMIGTVRFDQTFVYGLSSSNDWLPLFSNIKVDGLKLLLHPNTRGDSDQASFVARNIPVLFFHTGLTDEYHTEKDTSDRINYAGASKVVEAVIQTALAVDKLSAKLTWNPAVDRGNKASDRATPKGPLESPLKPPTR